MRSTSLLSEECAVNRLSDAMSLLPEKLRKEAKFIALLLEIQKGNIEYIFRQINKNNIEKAFKIIEISILIRPLETENFLTLISLISSNFNVENLPYSSDYFRSLLIARGILPHPNDGKEYNEAFAKFAKGSIEEAIREDNVEQFYRLVSDISFNAKNKVDICYLRECESYMQLIAYFGAVNCFRQAIMNDAFDLDGIAKCAIAGGSNEIVRILEQKGISFDNCFNIGVKYHRVELCDWLLMHAECERFDLSSSLEYFNYPAFFFVVIKEKLFNEALHIVSKKGHIEVVKYLIEQCHANVEAKDDDGDTPFTLKDDNSNCCRI